MNNEEYRHDFDLSGLSSEQQAQQKAMWRYLADVMGGQEEGIPFHQFMQAALYAPALGYYVGGSKKLGAEGDFVTAPEISPLFSRCVGRQCASVLEHLSRPQILEFGAGSGAMAADVLEELERLQCLPERYLILELSPELRQRQQQLLRQRLPRWARHIHWVEHLPEQFSGVMLANEVLDAMPVHVFRKQSEGVQELWVKMQEQSLVSHWLPAAPELAQAVSALEARLGVFPESYVSEINLYLKGWIQAVAHSLRQGALLAIDYGYDEAEYYHPQRTMGTLIAHYRHRAHVNPLYLPGLQDMTASVDFTAVADAGQVAGMELLDYRSQARFLISNGLEQMIAELDVDRVDEYLPAMQKIKQLILPGEMGERFKAIALGKSIPPQWWLENN